jgi:type IV pilus assembly protein PilA
MTPSTLAPIRRPMTSTGFRQRLALAMLTRKSKRTILEKGFTLVELMIVVVIIGILAAVALPNFLSQSTKAKLTEPQQKIAAGLKQAGVSYVEANTFSPGGTSLTCAQVGLETGNGWDYTCTGTATTMTISALGTAGGANAGLGTGNWVLTGATGVITKGTADTTP